MTKLSRSPEQGTTVADDLVTFSGHGYKVGDVITFTQRQRWYVRLWRWITRYKPPVMKITEIDSTTITIERER